MIKINNISKSYGGKLILDDINLSINKGCTALIGPNGIGKSTLFKLILNLIYPDSGKITYEINLISKNTFGYMPEEKALYSDLTVKENINFMTRLRKLKPKEIDSSVRELYECLNIEKIKDSPLNQLSKGNYQKVQFFISILHNPDIIILDEPFVGLDLTTCNQLKDEINKLNKKGKIIIFSSHNLSDVSEIADELVILKEKRVNYCGKLNELYDIYAEDKYLVKIKNTAKSYLEENKIPYQETLNFAEIILKSENDIFQMIRKNNLQAIEDRIISIEKLLPSLSKIYSLIYSV